VRGASGRAGAYQEGTTPWTLKELTSESFHSKPHHFLTIFIRTLTTHHHDYIMNSFTLLDPEPVTAVRALAAPVFSTTETVVASKKREY